MVEDEGFLAFFNQFLVEDVEHLEERGVIGNILHLADIEMAFVLGAVLTPILQCKAYILSHNYNLSFALYINESTLLQALTH